MKECISVIIPTYNSSKTILRCVNSILNQEGINVLFLIEILLIDDCSTDNTLELLKQIKEVEVYQNSFNSGGPNKGRNIGLKKSTGNWIVFIDHDDEWLPNRILNQLKFKDFDIITCGYNIYLNNIFQNSNCNYNNNGFTVYNSNTTFLNKLKRNPNSQITYFGSFLFKSKLKNIFLEEEFGQCDYDYILRLFHNIETVEVSIPLINRYVENSNLSLNEKYRLIDYEISNRIYDSFQLAYKKEVEVGRKRLNAAMGRYYFYINNGKESRKYLIASHFGPVNILLYITSHFSFIINRFYKVFI
jgi:glycosyltransferase involved in cell wall biosynthesis